MGDDQQSNLMAGLKLELKSLLSHSLPTATGCHLSGRRPLILRCKQCEHLHNSLTAITTKEISYGILVI